MTEVRLKTYQLRAELADILRRVSQSNTRATIMHYGEPIAYVVSKREIQELEELRKLFRSNVVQHAVKL